VSQHLSFESTDVSLSFPDENDTENQLPIICIDHRGDSDSNIGTDSILDLSNTVVMHFR